MPHLPDERRGMVVLPRLVASSRISCILQQQSHPAAAIWRHQHQPPRNSAHAQAKGQRQAHTAAATERRPPRGGNAGIDAHPTTSTSPWIDRLAHGHGGMEAAQDSECLSLLVIFVEQRGRGRSRKRSQLYSRLATYNNDFVALLTAEYRAEVRI